MWLTAPNQLGIAGWRTGNSIWPLEVHPGRGVTLGTRQAAVCLSASDDSGLPELRDQYVRGDELHLSFPQAEPHIFGLKLCIRPIAGFDGSSDRMGFETMVSIQTSFLDSHPTVDLSAMEPCRAEKTDVGSNEVAFTFAAGEGRSIVLLGRHDAPFTEIIEDETQTSLRLFGQFLEKGVIRRARPWVLLGQGATIAEDEVSATAAQLSASPVPLD